MLTLGRLFLTNKRSHSTTFDIKYDKTIVFYSRIEVYNVLVLPESNIF